MQGEVMVNMVKLMDPLVHLREMMIGYAKLCGKPIMMGDE